MKKQIAEIFSFERFFEINNIVEYLQDENQRLSALTDQLKIENEELKKDQ
jgi:hypothetical protein